MGNWLAVPRWARLSARGPMTQLQLSKQYNLANYALKIVFYSDTKRPSEEQDWIAVLWVDCHDLCRLMREGFHWSRDNVVPELGYYEPLRPKESRTVGGLKYFREYTLLEYPKNEAMSQWYGGFQLYGRTLDIISDFRFDQVRKENVVHVGGEDYWKRPVFAYSCIGGGAMDINCFYDKLRPCYGSWWFMGQPAPASEPLLIEATDGDDGKGKDAEISSQDSGIDLLSDEKQSSAGVPRQIYLLT